MSKSACFEYRFFFSKTGYWVSIADYKIEFFTIHELSAELRLRVNEKQIMKLWWLVKTEIYENLD